MNFCCVYCNTKGILCNVHIFWSFATVLVIVGLILRDSCKRIENLISSVKRGIYTPAVWRVFMCLCVSSRQVSTKTCWEYSVANTFCKLCLTKISPIVRGWFAKKRPARSGILVYWHTLSCKPYKHSARILKTLHPNIVTLWEFGKGVSGLQTDSEIQFSVQIKMFVNELSWDL